jgi:anthranilate synthase/aminodeoxychorismate synthase-like glutamine amidotransferase
MVLIIDNYDSFTYNLYQAIAALGQETEVVKHDKITLKQIEELKPSHIVISPGPKQPKSSGISNEVIKHFYRSIPILGVCLGHQCIGEVFGSNIVHAKVVMHGKVDQIYHNSSSLFKSMPNPFNAARYNSLVIDCVPKNFEKLAWSSDGSIMAIKHRDYELFGVQFHPESFMTPVGGIIIKEFLKC